MSADPPSWISRVLFTSAGAGALLALGLFLAGGPASDPVSIALVTAVTVIVPLGLGILPSSGASWDRWVAIAAIAQPICAACAVIALCQPAGRDAGMWSSAWMAFALLGAAMGLSRVGAGGGRRASGRRAAELCATAALAYLPIGAAWLVASRGGLRPLGFGSIIVALTAVHFHFAAFAAPILASRAIATLRGAPRRAATIAGLAIVAAQPIVAAGITASPALALAGTILAAAAVLTLSALVLGWVQRRLRSTAARVLLGVSAVAPLLSMPLAIAWALAEAGGPRLVGLDDMVRWHGTGNAYGFALVGLVAWAISSRRSA